MEEEEEENEEWWWKRVKEKEWKWRRRGEREGVREKKVEKRISNTPGDSTHCLLLSQTWSSAIIHPDRNISPPKSISPHQYPQPNPSLFPTLFCFSPGRLTQFHLLFLAVVTSMLSLASNPLLVRLHLLPPRFKLSSGPTHSALDLHSCLLCPGSQNLNAKPIAPGEICSTKTNHSKNPDWFNQPFSWANNFICHCKPGYIERGSLLFQTARLNLTGGRHFYFKYNFASENGDPGGKGKYFWSDLEGFKKGKRYPPF